MTEYHIRRKDVTQLESWWEPLEASWECENHFTALPLAESAARTLALRSDGDAAFQVVDTTGLVMLTAVVEKRLRIARRSASLEGVSERIPPGFLVPLLHQVMTDAAVRAGVFFRTRRRDERAP